MKFKKNFSQNFLINKYYLNNILIFINPQIRSIVLEIGFGKGVLSKKILLKLFNYNILVYFIELDFNFYLQFIKNYKFNIFNIDILQFDLFFIKPFTFYNFKLNLIGSLPYKITSLILIYLIKYLKIIINQYFLIQNEYFKNLISNNKFLSIILKCFYKIKNIFLLNNLSFFPRPQINSNFINFQSLYLTLINLNDFLLFKKFIKVNFFNKKIDKNKIHFPGFGNKILGNSVNNYINSFFFFKKKFLKYI